MHVPSGVTIGVGAEVGCIVLSGIGNCGSKVRSVLFAHNNIHFSLVFAIYYQISYPIFHQLLAQTTQHLLPPCHRSLPGLIPRYCLELA